jgi:hypothetical protein
METEQNRGYSTEVNNDRASILGCRKQKKTKKSCNLTKVTQPHPCKMQTEQNRGYSAEVNNDRASILG